MKENAKQNEFFTYSETGVQQKEYQEIPFATLLKDGFSVPLPYDRDFLIGQKCNALFFLGMTTDDGRCSEWWGQAERFYDNTQRLFIGDTVGRISIVFTDGTMDLIPLLFGVNVWNYDLVEDFQPGEMMNHYNGPYKEPFASDSKAADILKNSLRLMRNENASKSEKYVLGIRLNPSKTVEKITFLKDSSKQAGFVISAITALLSDCGIHPGWILTDNDYYLRRDYFINSDKLSRLLYQYRDEVPSLMAYERPEGYRSPEVSFTGTGTAELYTNVYAHNIHDMVQSKITDDGMPHTSSAGTLNYGCYVGLGTFAKSDSYASHIWSRDVGRIITEVSRTGEPDKVRRCCKTLNQFLYDPNRRYAHPNFKRIANASTLGNEELNIFVAGKENDGHAALMMGIYTAFVTGAVDLAWLIQNKKALTDAADWFFWQIENPEQSGFDRVLYSESEASTQLYGGKDLFSNSYAYFALLAYETLFLKIGLSDLAEKCQSASLTIRKGIEEVFIGKHPRFGKIFTDTIYDCWTYEYKRFAPLFLQSDIIGYDPECYDAEFYEICHNTYQAQKEDYYDPASGRQMGYGQGYLTLAALMLDEYEDYSDCIDWASLFSYHHGANRFIVPEGVICHPSRRYWFRNSDLGNGVQQGEIVKCTRLLLGIDDIRPDVGVSFIPRLPHGWSGIWAEKWPVSINAGGEYMQIPVSYRYTKTKNGYSLSFDAKSRILVRKIRIGPFDGDASDFTLHGCDGKPFATMELNGRRYLTIDYFGETDHLDLNAQSGF